jgi:hypothetical protein
MYDAFVFTLTDEGEILQKAKSDGGLVTVTEQERDWFCP